MRNTLFSKTPLSYGGASKKALFSFQKRDTTLYFGSDLQNIIEKMMAEGK
jgi:hypothetical protein